MSEVIIRPAASTDADALARIYNYYIANTVVTFEEEPVAATIMAGRLADVQGIPLPWLVAEIDGKVVGYACATRWKVRSAYRHAAETTVYLEHGRQGQGLGTTLYSALLPVLKSLGMHVAIGGAAQPNPASLALHEKLGFTRIGTFREVGFKHGQRVDVAYWQILL